MNSGFFFRKNIRRMTKKKIPKIPKNYFCDFCDYNTSNKKDYDKHKMTLKHKIRTNTNEKMPKNAEKCQEHICECSKVFKHASSLWNHKQKCKFQKIDEINDTIISEKQEEKQIVETNNDYKNMFIDLIKQNQEFKTLIIEQTKQLNEQQKENQTLHKQLIDVVKDGKTINNTINNNNQSFNLNFFLNNTCKDAMNMSEFIENMDVNFKDIEYIGRNGYVNGMTNMILSRIKDLDVTKRPLHCTDLKRETMYIKDNDEWSKDTPDNTQLRNMVKIVAKHNQYQFPLWREKHPSSDDMNSETFEFSLRMIQNILGDVGEEQIKLDNKVIRNLSKHILVDKN